MQPAREQRWDKSSRLPVRQLVSLDGQHCRTFLSIQAFLEDDVRLLGMGVMNGRKPKYLRLYTCLRNTEHLTRLDGCSCAINIFFFIFGLHAKVFKILRASEVSGQYWQQSCFI